MKEVLLGVGVSTHDRTDVLASVTRALAGGERAWVACANAHSLVVAQELPAFRDALNSMDVVLPDGISVALASRWFGRGWIRAKYGGPDFFEDVNHLADSLGTVRYYFLGSTPAVLEQICRRLSRQYPHIQVVGTASPPFRSITLDERHQLASDICQSAPTVLWVGMTAPKQEVLLHSLAGLVDVPVAGCIGAAFDYFAGVKKRPKWVVRARLAWAYRLFTEPCRLWRRYFVSAPLFFVWAWRYRHRRVSPSRSKR